jgi:hypothetical protein
MSRRWRWSLVVIIAAAVLGSFLPGAVSARPPERAGASLTASEQPLALIACFVASCNKGTPAPAAPALIVAALATLAATGALASGARRIRRTRLAVALPRGTMLTLFHPPQFS